MTASADVVGQELSAIVNIGAARNARLQDTLAQRVQRRLAAGAVRDIPACKDTAAGVQPRAQVQAVQRTIRPHALHIKGVGIADPKVVCVDALVLAAYVGAAQVIVFFVAHAAQNHHRVRHSLCFAVESMIPRQGHRFGHILLCPLFCQRNAAGHGKLTFIKKK